MKTIRTKYRIISKQYNRKFVGPLKPSLGEASAAFAFKRKNSRVPHTIWSFGVTSLSPGDAEETYEPELWDEAKNTLIQNGVDVNYGANDHVRG
jgi:hypothetical protein